MRLNAMLRKTTRMVYNRPYLPFTERLKKFDLNDLDQRLERTCVLTVVKLIRSQSSGVATTLMRYWVNEQDGGRFKIPRNVEELSHQIVRLMKSYNAKRTLFDAEEDSIATIKSKLKAHYMELRQH